jgi:hypothetical protein
MFCPVFKGFYCFGDSRKEIVSIPGEVCCKIKAGWYRRNLLVRNGLAKVWIGKRVWQALWVL